MCCMRVGVAVLGVVLFLLLLLFCMGVGWACGARGV